MRKLKLDFVKHKNNCLHIVILMNSIYVRKGLFDAAINNYRSLLRYYRIHEYCDMQAIISIENKIQALETKQKKLVFV